MMAIVMKSVLNEGQTGTENRDSLMPLSKLSCGCKMSVMVCMYKQAGKLVL